LILATAIDQLNPRWAALAVSLVVLLSFADGFLALPPSARVHQRLWFHGQQDLDSVLRAAPKYHQADLPILDLPPPDDKAKTRWLLYYYYQTEHHQKMIWAEGLPEHLQGPMATFRKMLEDPHHYGASVRTRDRFRQETQELGVGLIALHLHLAREDRAAAVSALLDSCFSRIQESDRTILWKTK
jgi:hypothetical protein